MRKISLAGIAFVAIFCFTSGVSANPCDTDLPIDLPRDCADIRVSHPIEGLQNFRIVLTPDNGIDGQAFSL